MTAESSLRQQVEEVLTRFKSELYTFTQQVRSPNPVDGGTQTDLLNKLDPVFAADKELQEVFRKGTASYLFHVSDSERTATALAKITATSGGA